MSLHPVWLQDVAGRCLLALAEEPWDGAVTPQQSPTQGQRGQHQWHSLHRPHHLAQSYNKFLRYKQKGAALA